MLLLFTKQYYFLQKDLKVTHKLNFILHCFSGVTKCHPQSWWDLCSSTEHHRHTGQFFPGGLSHLCPKNFLTAPEKTDILTCKITLPDSPHPVLISKNPELWALYLAQQNEFHFFRLINTVNVFFTFGCWLLPEKFSLCPKNNGFARVWGAAAPEPPWLVRLRLWSACVFISVVTTLGIKFYQQQILYDHVQHFNNVP